MFKRIAQGWTDFWFKPMDTIRLDTFRVTLGISLFIYMLGRWQHATEWLTAAGFHYSAATAPPHTPLVFPLLLPEALPVFGVILFASLFAFILGWQSRWINWLLLACLIYVTYADRISAFTLNKLYIISLTVLALAPRGGKNSPAWPVRILQATLLIQFGTAGWCKILHGDWIQNTHVLWSQVQGPYCTDLAGWMLTSLPIWSWGFMQYSALLFELSAPILFMVKRLRPLAYVWGLIFLTLIALTMHLLIYFSLQLLCFFVLFMSEKTLHRVRERLLLTSKTTSE